ncbi:MAG: hypothetical protein M1830_010284 [Pleopsidium flavum]|nr:MAG: hypothetical protein M1830_010284 [Pleopsidium flavum]
MATVSILIINPNTTQSMTDNLKPLIESLGYTNTQYTYFTAPTGPASINDAEDATLSTTHTLPHLLPLLAHHSTFLIACYSAHPLVPALKTHTSKPVLGIFEASVTAALQLLNDGEKFGIVSTGQVWEGLLTNAVCEFLGFPYPHPQPYRREGGERQAGARFAGVETTGLTASDLHNLPVAEVEERMREAAMRLVRGGDVGVLCLGCAGMVGMERVVRGACVEVLGGERGRAVKVVDGVVAGVGALVGLVRGIFEGQIEGWSEDCV